MAIVVYDADHWSPKRDAPELVCSYVTSALDMIIEENWSYHDEFCDCDWHCNKPRLY